MKTDFSEKNARRARMRQADPAAYQAGRRARKAFARGGCFGKIKKAHIVEVCSLGTIGLASPPADGGDDAEG